MSGVMVGGTVPAGGDATPGGRHVASGRRPVSVDGVTSVARMTGHEFARDVAHALGVESLSDHDADEILAMAGVAAHASERLAAPLCAFLAGRSGRSLEDAREAVAMVAK